MRALLQKIIRYALKAPSCGNSHPWKFRTEGCSLILYPDYSGSHRFAGGDHHELFIALGCAVENAVVAANAFGYREMVTYRFSHEQDSVRITLEPSDSTGDQSLFLAIDEEGSGRTASPRPVIPADQLADLALKVRERDVFLKIYDTAEELGRLLPLVAEAAALQYRDQDYPAWVRFPYPGPDGEEETSGGELPKEPAVPHWMGRLYRNHQVSAKAVARKACDLVKDSAALVLFSTTNNTKEGWVNLGRSYERLSLRARALGIGHALLNTPCEEPSVREKLKRDLGYANEEPLLLVRLGCTEEAASDKRQVSGKSIGQ